MTTRFFKHWRSFNNNVAFLKLLGGGLVYSVGYDSKEGWLNDYNQAECEHFAKTGEWIEVTEAEAMALLNKTP